MLICGNIFSQTKEELIKAIKTINVVDDGPNLISSSEDSSKISDYNAENFEKLKLLLSEEELLKFSRSRNKVLRTYAIKELIWSENKNFNIVEAFLNELKKNQVVETASGCLVGDFDKVYSIVYHTYWNFIGEEKRKNDVTLQKLDSVIINSKKNLYWLIYLRTFENGKLEETLLPQIEKLAFKRNNSYALGYLKEYYPNKYDNQIEEYFANVFPKAKFKADENDIYFFHLLITMLLESGNEKMKNIAIEKLKKEFIWKEQHRSWFENVLEKSNINL